jgi:catechol 2,3-dioxygenase-like lactoylglutathione lyase family enzyme
MIIGLHHVQLAMPSNGEDAAREFYSGMLGIEEVPKPPNLARRGGVWFENQSIRIHLGVDADFRPALKAHPGLLVRDLAALSQRLQGAGFEITEAEPLDDCDHV